MSNLNFHELEDILDENKVDYSHITLEVTETAIISDIEMAISRLLRLKRYGLKIALDDFGTGYSSLTYLKKMPIDTIKLDRSFVKSIEENDADTYESIKKIFGETFSKEFDIDYFGTLVKESLSDRTKVSSIQKADPKLILDKVLRELYIK